MLGEMKDVGRSLKLGRETKKILKQLLKDKILASRLLPDRIKNKTKDKDKDVGY